MTYNRIVISNLILFSCRWDLHLFALVIPSISLALAHAMALITSGIVSNFSVEHRFRCGWQTTRSHSLSVLINRLPLRLNGISAVVPSGIRIIALTGKKESSTSSCNHQRSTVHPPRVLSGVLPTSSFPSSIIVSFFKCRAVNEIRTRDLWLGKPSLYLLSYYRRCPDE